jgi:soluble P-type ATPase
VGPHAIADGDDKARFVEGLGAERCVAIGNGANDAAMLAAAALGIAVVGPEGAAGSALLAADVVARSIADALDLVLDERALVATLRC